MQRSPYTVPQHGSATGSHLPLDPSVQSASRLHPAKTQART